MQKNCGVYEIKNRVSGGRYIGSAMSLIVRREHHRAALQANRHKNSHLQNAWNKYGSSAFEFTIRILCAPQDVIGAEQGFINYYGIDNLYNIDPIAGSRRGHHPSKETRRKISRSQLGKHHSEETKRKMSRRPSEETREKMSLSQMGKRHSEETRRKMSRSQMGNTNGLGSHHSEETKKKIGLMALGNQRGAKMYPSFISPDGCVYPSGINLSAFCREHMLDSSTMSKVRVGYCKQHKGWRLA